jgi:hypothetical protein
MKFITSLAIAGMAAAAQISNQVHVGCDKLKLSECLKVVGADPNICLQNYCPANSQLYARNSLMSLVES